MTMGMNQHTWEYEMMLLSYLLIVLISYKFIPVIDLLYFVHLRSLQLSWFYSQNLYMLFSKRDLPSFICFKTLLGFERDFLRAFAHPLQHTYRFWHRRGCQCGWADWLRAVGGSRCGSYLRGIELIYFWFRVWEIFMKQCFS